MADEIKKEFLGELLSKTPDRLVSLWLIDRIPHVFQNDRDVYVDWKTILASRMGVDPATILVAGSGCVGISLNPHKNYRSFDNGSDVDVAIISDYYFNEAWKALRGIGSQIHKLAPREKQIVDDHVKKYIYWGTIAAEHILSMFPFGKKWRAALSHMSNVRPTLGRDVKARIYKDFESFRAYHVNNMKELRDNRLA